MVDIKLIINDWVCFSCTVWQIVSTNTRSLLKSTCKYISLKHKQTIITFNFKQFVNPKTFFCAFLSSALCHRFPRDNRECHCIRQQEASCGNTTPPRAIYIFQCIVCLRQTPPPSRPVDIIWMRNATWDWRSLLYALSIAGTSRQSLPWRFYAAVVNYSCGSRFFRLCLISLGCLCAPEKTATFRSGIIRWVSSAFCFCSMGCAENWW